MTIATLDQYVAAYKQIIAINRVAQTTVANAWFSMMSLAGNPGGGTLAGTSTAAGVVPSGSSGSLTQGCPIVNDFGTGKTGYLTRVLFGSAGNAVNPCRILIADMLFKAGAYAFNANTTLASQPSYSSRVPGGTDFTGLQIWVESVTNFTGNLSININYTNQAGTTGRSTGTVTSGIAPVAGRMFQMPLQAGDTGVQKIEKVVATVSTVGTFNVLVLRPLWVGRQTINNDGRAYGLNHTGLPLVFDNQASAGASALITMMCNDSTNGGIFDALIEVASG